jgi:hypothetical protein
MLFDDGHKSQAAIVLRRAAETDIEPAVEQALMLFPRWQVVERDAAIRCRRTKTGDQPWCDGKCRYSKSDIKISGKAGYGAMHLPVDVVVQLEKRACFALQKFSERRQFGAMAAALEQRSAHCSFQSLNLLGKGRLGDEQFCRSFAVVTAVDQLNEGSEKLYFHSVQE